MSRIVLKGAIYNPNLQSLPKKISPVDEDVLSESCTVVVQWLQL